MDLRLGYCTNHKRNAVLFLLGRQTDGLEDHDAIHGTELFEDALEGGSTTRVRNGWPFRTLRYRVHRTVDYPTIHDYGKYA